MEAKHMNDARKIDYRLRRQSSKKWRSLLSAMAKVLVSQTDSNNTKAAFKAIGITFAGIVQLSPSKTIEETQQAICNVWEEMDWGTVLLEEHGDTLRIVHHSLDNGRLLIDAFNGSTEFWAAAFLEGVYQKWLGDMSVSTHLNVKQISEVDEFGSVEYELSA
jgi:hypothetical protein